MSTAATAVAGPAGVVRTIGRLISPVNENAGANLRMFALLGHHDMVGDAVGTHHLVDEFHRPAGPLAGTSASRRTDHGPDVR